MVLASGTPDPSSLPFTSFGPYTFLVVVAWLLWFAAKEYRKGRAEDVEAAREEATRQKVRADTIEGDYGRQIAGLKQDLENLQGEVERLRDTHIRETAKAHEKTERWMIATFSHRAMLIEHGFEPPPLPAEESLPEPPLPHEENVT